jgi:hypothetical protein
LVSAAYSFPTKKELNSTLPTLVFTDFKGAEWYVIFKENARLPRLFGGLLGLMG